MSFYKQQDGGCWNDPVWRNKYMKKETKSNIYKATVRPIMTYALETRAETTKPDKCWKQMR
jgi:hypothetical protein